MGRIVSKSQKAKQEAAAKAAEAAKYNADGSRKAYYTDPATRRPDRGSTSQLAAQPRKVSSRRLAARMDLSPRSRTTTMRSRMTPRAVR